MSRIIVCQKLHQELEGLDFQTYPGDLGKKIYDNISKQAWGDWLKHQTTLINEYRLNMLDQSARDFLKAEMQKFLFGTGSEKPSGFKEV
jgi:Fe-S cluster biosynthesis and repair protein YggX